MNRICHKELGQDCPFCEAGLKPKRKVQVALCGPDGKTNGKYMLMDEDKVDAIRSMNRGATTVNPSLPAEEPE